MADGLVIVAAALAVIVVVLVALDAQRRRAERQRRLDIEAAVRERGRQKTTLARALLFEIDSFYRHYLADVERALSGSGEGQYPVVKWVPAQPFPVYAGNAGRLGELDEETLEAVIYYYGAAAAYLSALSDYRLAMERVLRKETPETSIPEAWLHLARLREELPGMLRETEDICRKLCELTGVPFQYLRGAAPAEPGGAPAARVRPPARPAARAAHSVRAAPPRTTKPVN